MPVQMPSHNEQYDSAGSLCLLALVLLGNRKQGVRHFDTRSFVLVEIQRECPKDQESKQIVRRKDEIDPRQPGIEGIDPASSRCVLQVQAIGIDRPGLEGSKKTVGAVANGNRHSQNVVTARGRWFRHCLGDDHHQRGSDHGGNFRRSGKNHNERDQEPQDLGENKVDQERFFGNELSTSQTVLAHGLELDLVLFQLVELELVVLKGNRVGQNDIGEEPNREEQIGVRNRIARM